MKKIVLFLVMLAVQIFAQNLSGVYILSEGGFSPQTSMLSFYNSGSTGFTQNIFTPGYLGLYPDGMIYSVGKIYICEQGSWGGSGKVYQLDSAGTVLNSADAGTNPYSLALANGKLYLTNGPVNSVSVVNADDLSVVDSITTGVYPQEILASGNLVFVANTSVYGGAVDSTITVIDAVGDTVVTSIRLKPGISSIAEAGSGFIFAGCSGDENTGIIYKIDTENFSKKDSFKVAGYGFGKDLSYDGTGNYLSFISYTNDIVKYDLESKTVSVIASPELGSYFYGYSLDPVSGLHFVTDAKDFSSQGSMNIYNNSSVLINSFTTGIAPRRIALSYSETHTAVNGSDEVQLSFNLAQNYPNPFNPTTTITYQIPETGFVTLKIYNPLGEEISVIVNNIQSAGTHVINFDGSGISSGVYIYQLKTGNFSSIRKMILMK